METLQLEPPQIKYCLFCIKPSAAHFAFVCAERILPSKAISEGIDPVFIATMCFTCLHLWSNQQNSQRTFRINSALNKVGYWNLWDDEIMLTESWVGLWRWRYRYSDAAKTHPPAQPKKICKKMFNFLIYKTKITKKIMCTLWRTRPQRKNIVSQIVHQLRAPSP